MALTDRIVKGMIIMYNNEPHLVAEREFYKPGKGNALNRTKLRGLRSGKVISATYKSGEKVDELQVETKNMLFSYYDDSNAYFMDPQTFEMVSISLDMVSGGTDFLLADTKYIVTFYEGEALSIQLPAKLTLTVIETPDAVKGDTVNNANKEAKVETGAVVNVPMFIKNGDRIVVNTETGAYFSKE